MFSQKRAKLVTNCDKYLDLYDKCNIGCEICKFNPDVKRVKRNKINFEQYHNCKVLVCYKTDPYVNNDLSLVAETINKLHQQGCKIVFLTRKADMLENQLNLFNSNDYVGISLSENCTKNSSLIEAKRMYQKAKNMGLKTWLSLEPVETADYANQVIKELASVITFIRVGRNDLIDYDWDKIKKEIITGPNIFIK